MAQVDLRCHHCNQWIGESPAAMEIVGIFKFPRDRALTTEPRLTIRCRACGWINVFQQIAAAVPAWRAVTLKGA